MYVLKSRYYVLGVALLAAALVVALAPIAQSGEQQTCFNRAVNIPGTSGPDVIIGDPQTVGDTDNPNDVIHGFGGQDNIRGEGDFGGNPEGGVDYICGGQGDDPFMDGADKKDFIMGGDGNDLLDGDNFPSPFRDFLFGNSGDDTFTGGQGNDHIEGGSGGDMVDVGAGTVNAGADNVASGRGNDTINEAGDGAVDTINCGSGRDTVTADANDNVSRNCEDVTTPT